MRRETSRKSTFRRACRVQRRIVLPVMIAAGIACGSAARAGPTVAELVEVADPESLAASTDGRRVAFRVQRASLQRNSYTLDWYVADLTTGIVRRVGGGGDPIFGDAGPLETEPVFWSSDGRFIYHRALVDGAIGIWRTAADGSGSRPVVVEDADVEGLEKSPDGGAILYRLGPTRDEIARAERREYDEGILVDGSVHLAQSLYRGASVNGRMASQRLTGRWYARGGLLWRAPRTSMRLDLATLITSEAGAAAPPTIAPLATTSLDQTHSVRSPTGDVATVRLTAGKTTLDVRRAGSDALSTCRAEPCRQRRIVAVAWRPGHDVILFTTQDRHYRQSLHLWEVGTGRVGKVAEADGLLSGSREATVPCALTRAAAVCVAASAVSPPRVERIDLATGRRSVLFDPNAGLRRRRMPKVEHLSWSLPDGRIATGTILRPVVQGVGGAPLFVNYYFCPGYLRGGVGDDFPLAPFADSGFVVACINMVPFTDPKDGIARYRDSLAAVEGLVDLLAARGLVDRARVGMGGFSAGSEATMWIAMNSGLLAAAALASPPYEPSIYWVNAVRGRDFASVLRHFYQLGSPDEMPERWRLVAPALNVERIKAPLLMQFPEQEARHAGELLGRLSNTNTPVEMYAFPEEGHIKIQPRHRLAANRRNLDWFRYWLQGHVDPDPSRAEQYRRWEELRRRREGPP